MNIGIINKIDEIGLDLEKAMMMASEVKDTFLDTAPPTANDQQSRDDFFYKMAWEIDRYSIYGAIMLDYLAKTEKALNSLRDSFCSDQDEMTELKKNIEKNINDAADLMEAITNGAATGEMVMNNADVAHDFLQTALYGFSDLVKDPGSGQSSGYDEWCQKNGIVGGGASDYPKQ